MDSSGCHSLDPFPCPGACGEPSLPFMVILRACGILRLHGPHTQRSQNSRGLSVRCAESPTTVVYSFLGRPCLHKNLHQLVDWKIFLQLRSGSDSSTRLESKKIPSCSIPCDHNHTTVDCRTTCQAGPVTPVIILCPVRV